MRAVTGVPKKTRPPGPPLSLAIPLLLAGVLAAIVTFIGLGTALIRPISSASTWRSPFNAQIVLRPGAYLLYVQAGSNELRQSEVKVVGPGGATVPVGLEERSESVTVHGRRYSGSIGFTISRAGTYSIGVPEPGVAVAVAPSLTDTAEANLGWAIGFVVSLLAALVGLILLIIALVQRSAARKRVLHYPGGVWGGAPGGGWPPNGGMAWPAAPMGGPGWPPPPSSPAPSSSPWGLGAPAPPNEPSPPPGKHPDPDGQPTGWPQPSSKPQYPAGF